MPLHKYIWEIWNYMQIPVVQDIVFFSNLWCHVGDHPQGDLAMFGYRTTMKVEIDWNSSISWLLVNKCVEKW
jgi:hypothetical protein